MKYRIALFDMDDTLIVSAAQKWAQHKHLGSTLYGVTITDELLREHWGRPFMQMIASLYGPVADPEEIAEHIYATEIEFPRLELEGAVAAVSSLMDAGINVGIVTSAFLSQAQRALDGLGFDVTRFIGIVGADVTEFHKPDHRVFDAIVPSGVPLSSVVYVGDLLVDLATAQNAGVDFIGVSSGVISASELVAAGASVVVPSVIEAAELILSS